MRDSEEGFFSNPSSLQVIFVGRCPLNEVDSPCHPPQMRGFRTRLRIKGRVGEEGRGSLPPPPNHSRCVQTNSIPPIAYGREVSLRGIELGWCCGPWGLADPPHAVLYRDETPGGGWGLRDAKGLPPTPVRMESCER